MVEQRGPDNSVDALGAQALGELAQRKYRNGEVRDGPIPERERVDPPVLNFRLLAAGKGPLHGSELRDAELAREVAVERDFRTAGIDEEGDLLATVDAHADERQRIGFYELEARALPVAAQLVRRPALEAFKLRHVQGRILRNDQFVGGDVDAVERGHRALEIVAAIERLRQHDLGVGVTRP